MQAVLAQMDLEDALLGIDVMKEKTTAALWKRIEQICMSKTLTSKLYMKQCLYAHRLEEGASVHEHLTVFKEIFSNLEAMEVQYDKEDLGLILFCLLPTSYSTFRDMILYSRESIIVYEVDEVYDSLTLYDKMKHFVVKPDSQGEGLIVHGRQDRNADDDREGHRNGILVVNLRVDQSLQTEEKQPENSDEADVVEDYSDGELLVVSVNNSKVSEEWILDSGCTFHMSPDRDWFTTYETVSEGVTLMGNNASCKIAGVGTIKVKMLDGVVRTLSDVRHVPELKRNLISLSTLDSKGYKYTAENGVLKISKGSIVVMKGLRKTTKLYVLQDFTVTGHMSENGMAELSKRGLLGGTRRESWSIFILICGGHPECLREIVQVRRDYETLDISPYSTAKWHCRTKEQNDHEEGSMYVVKCRLTKVILGQSSLYCIFLINRSPSVAIEKKTPQEVWSGNPANYFDLKMFRCPAYAHVDNGKLESRSIKFVFLGYKAGVKGYKLWCPENRKVVISRNVVFDETAMLPNLSLKDSSNKENQKREIKPLKKYVEADLVVYALYVAEDIDVNQEPSNYSEAVSCEDSEKWMFAMQEDMKSLHKNRTWDLVKLPKDKKVVLCKWVFKKKEGTLGVEEPRYKTRLVAKGYSQIPGVDFTDVFSPVVKHSSIRALLGIVAMHDLDLE
ncbi:hypothetical protein CXB51_008403 [Gossypium anomalum]|uniref:Reverse transcriptase Ty1/copia-type domain-containing protein n=1 Tax=Gossypium anomalum TaxID=47600 RepID=A0A8J5ZK19_9ROSI|nr:hypothetical protein CXB51_008403 [Gossypium anomalum]